MTQRDNTANRSTTGRPANAALLVAPGCAHCPGVLDGLGKLVKEGLIGRLEVVDITAHPEAAQAAGTRSVPWCRIGPYTLEGAHSTAELREWAEAAVNGASMGVYVSYLLEHHRLDQAIALVRESPSLLHDLVRLIADLDTPMAVRIGIGAVFEDVQADGLLSGIVHPLGALTQASEPQVRADACHYLGLTGSADAVSYVTPLLDDADEDVAEIAAESLPLLPRPEPVAGC